MRNTEQIDALEMLGLSPLRELVGPRVLACMVAPGGRLILCSYGSSRPEGARAEPLVEDLQRWGLQVDAIHDVVSSEHGFIITRVVSLLT